MRHTQKLITNTQTKTNKETINVSVSHLHEHTSTHTHTHTYTHTNTHTHTQRFVVFAHTIWFNDDCSYHHINTCYLCFNPHSEQMQRERGRGRIAHTRSNPQVLHDMKRLIWWWNKIQLESLFIMYRPSLRNWMSKLTLTLHLSVVHFLISYNNIRVFFVAGCQIHVWNDVKLAQFVRAQDC